MSKIQTVLGLLLFLFILFSMDTIFGNPLRETFSNQVGLPGGRNIGIDGVGKKLDYKIVAKTNKLNGNMIYSGSGFLGATAPYPKGDDQPLFFGFSSQ
jgi:hypothetical protein